MASMPYPPWKSAPSSLEGRDRKKWWSNAKEAVLHPWWRRSKRKVKKRKASGGSPYPYTPRTQEEQFRAVRGEPMPRFSPFMNQLNFPHFSPPNVGDLQPRVLSEGYGDSSQGTTPPPSFDPEPAPYKPTRPSLTNVFPMYSTLQVAPKKPAEGLRRHSTGTSIERRPSVHSTESSERSLDRRERRVRAARALPVLNVLPKRKNSAPAVLPYALPPSCQVSPPHINCAYSPDEFEFEPPPMSPTDVLKLKVIKEESSDSEIKGFDEFMMY